MAHQTEIVVNGQTVEVTEFDHTAQEIDDGITNLSTITGGATTPQAALNALGAGVRPNLLDNGDFRAGHVVNQRGQTSYSGTGMTIDRWYINGSAAKITVQADGIYYEKTADATSYGIWQQKFPLGNLEGKELTFSVFVDDVCYNTTIPAGWTYSNGTILKTFNINNGSKYMSVYIICDADNVLTFRFYYGGSVAAATTGYLLQGAKLEEGEGQTLAYQDEDGDWHRLPQPESNYVAQLEKCRRYFRRFPANYILGVTQNTNSGNTVCFRYPCDPPMRTTPVLSMQNGSDLTGALDNGMSPVTPTSVNLNWLSNTDAIGFYFVGASGGPGFICKRYIDASAEL